MLAALVLAGIVAAPIGTAALLVQSRRRARQSGAWPAIRRFAFAIVGTAVLALAVIGALRLLGDLLWLFELFAAILACAYLWEICDALGSEHWRRRLNRSRAACPTASCPSSACRCPRTMNRLTW